MPCGASVAGATITAPGGRMRHGRAAPRLACRHHRLCLPRLHQQRQHACRRQGVARRALSAASRTAPAGPHNGIQCRHAGEHQGRPGTNQAPPEEHWVHCACTHPAQTRASHQAPTQHHQGSNGVCTARAPMVHHCVHPPGTNSSGTSSVMSPRTSASSYALRPCTHAKAHNTSEDKKDKKAVKEGQKQSGTEEAGQEWAACRAASHTRVSRPASASGSPNPLRQAQHPPPACGSSSVSTARFSTEPRASRHCWL